MGFPNTNVLDTFNRGDEGPPPSIHWSTGVRNGDQGLIVSSSQCRVDTSGGPNFGGRWNTQTDSGVNWCEAFVTLSWLPATGYSVDVFARVRDPATAAMDGYAVRYSDPGGHGGAAVYIYRIDNGAYTQLNTQVVAFANGDWLGIQIIGSAIGLWRYNAGAWAQIITATDATYPDAGYIGLGVIGNDTSIRFDNFGGGPFPAGAGGGIGGGTMAYEGWLIDGVEVTAQEESIWLHPHGTFIPFKWGGMCMRIEETTENLGAVTVSQKLNPRGGLQRHGVQAGAPAETTGTLTMKRLQLDRKKSDLKSCWWDVDVRHICGNVDADAWYKWDEITRHCYGKATGRTLPATSFDGDNTPELIGLEWTWLWTEDLYRVTGEVGAPWATAVQIMDVTSCQPARCPDNCDDQEDCIVVAVTEDDGATPKITVNRHGGDLDQWEAAVALTSFGINDASQVACAGSFVVVTCEGDASLIYSRDLGTTQANVQTTDMAAHAPISVDMHTQTFIIVGGADGYIYRSLDGASTWETVDAGNATTSDLTRIQIAPDNSQVIYAVSSAADVVVKSENGGETWYAQAATGTAGTGPLSLWVASQNYVLVGTDAGEIFETTDGGETWTEQANLLITGTKANWQIKDIDGCGCGVIGLIVKDAVADDAFFLRNVDNGASGRWEEPAEYEAAAATYYYNGLTCCGPNSFIAGGGLTATGATVLLLE